jgi:hypothetical protein
MLARAQTKNRVKSWRYMVNLPRYCALLKMERPNTRIRERGADFSCKRVFLAKTHSKLTVLTFFTITSHNDSL